MRARPEGFERSCLACTYTVSAANAHRVTSFQKPFGSTYPMYLFHGIWHLLDVNFYNVNNEIVKLYGQAPRGMIMYDARGYMAVQIMQRDRPPLPKSRTAQNALDDYVKILRGYIAYFGTYDVDETARTVTHHLQGSLFPDWVGTDLLRHYEFLNDDRKLILTTAPSALRGETLRGELIWQRA